MCLSVTCNTSFLSQLVSDHQKGKEVISNYWNATCKKKGTRKGSSHLVEAVLCAETTKTTSGRTMELRETSSIRYTDSVSSHEQMSEGLQKLPHNRTTGSKAKYFRYEKGTCNIPKFFFLLMYSTYRLHILRVNDFRLSRSKVFPSF